MKLSCVGRLEGSAEKVYSPTQSLSLVQAAAVVMEDKVKSGEESVKKPFYTNAAMKYSRLSTVVRTP